MSYLNYQPMDLKMDLKMDRSFHLDTSQSYNRYNSMAHSPNIRSPSSEMYTTGSYTTSGWITPVSMDYSRSISGTDTSGFSLESRFNRTTMNCSSRDKQIGNQESRKADKTFTGRGDQPYFEPAYDTSATRHRHSVGSTPSLENIRTRLKALEDKNAMIREKCRKLFTENESFKSCLDKERLRNEELERNVASLNEELAEERKKLLEMSNNQAERETLATMETATSTTDIVTTVERGVQNWSLCQGCQNKLENCMNGVPTVTITKSELDILEKDMQSLRDAVVAREEAWDKAMERERTYRQQILRLTCEAITNRHIQESRDEEIRLIKNTLKERESDLKSLQKQDNTLSKIITKLYRYQRDHEGHSPGNGPTSLDINDKEQRIIEDCLRQASTLKGKQKAKSRCNSAIEKSSGTESQRTSPRNKSIGHGKD